MEMQMSSLRKYDDEEFSALRHHGLSVRERLLFTILIIMSLNTALNKYTRHCELFQLIWHSS